MTDKELVSLCLQGDKQSLEKLVRSVNSSIFNLALRFLWNRNDAEDATQEILVRIITNLSKYEGRSKFSTWAFRVAVNYLITAKASLLEKQFHSFDEFSNDLHAQLDPSPYDQPDKPLLEKEIKTGCTMAMLQCLSRDLRIAFILGTVFHIKSHEAAEMTNITAANFRKRVQQSKELVRNFLSGHCGVYDPANPCRCAKRITTAIKSGRVDKAHLSFTGKVEGYSKEMEELHSLSGIYENHGMMTTDRDRLTEIFAIVTSKRIIGEA